MGYICVEISDQIAFSQHKLYYSTCFKCAFSVLQSWRIESGGTRLRKTHLCGGGGWSWHRGGRSPICRHPLSVTAPLSSGSQSGEPAVNFDRPPPNIQTGFLRVSRLRGLKPVSPAVSKEDQIRDTRAPQKHTLECIKCVLFWKHHSVCMMSFPVSRVTMITSANLPATGISNIANVITLRTRYWAAQLVSTQCCEWKMSRLKKYRSGKVKGHILMPAKCPFPACCNICQEIVRIWGGAVVILHFQK